MSDGKVGYSFSSASIETVKSSLSHPENIVSFPVIQDSVEILEMDWVKFDAITDEEIDKAIADDPDAYEPTDDEWNRVLRFVSLG